jgi:hypothetical protein
MPDSDAAMSEILIITDLIASDLPEASALSQAAQVDAFLASVAAANSSGGGFPTVTARVIDSLQWASNPPDPAALFCPLTLDLPTNVVFWGSDIFSVCRSLRRGDEQLDHIVLGVTEPIELPESARAGLPTRLWLPIVLTAKGPLYGELIGLNPEPIPQLKQSVASTPAQTPSYAQPIHLADQQRQPIYQRSFQLLSALNAPASVYLVEWSVELQHEALSAMRLVGIAPFPDGPAIASVGVQTPDLYTCYWKCIAGEPLGELTIV